MSKAPAHVPTASEPQLAFLKKYPDKTAAIFEAVNSATVKSASCVFGGCLRDTDCSAFYGMAIPVNDYDMRIWVIDGFLHESAGIILDHLTHKGATIREAQSWDKDKPRYEADFLGTKIDISFRSKPYNQVRHESASSLVAIDRVRDSDVGLSAIAMDDRHNVWIMPEYLTDRAGLKLTVLSKDHLDRSLAYAERLKAKKYPLHDIAAPR